MALTDTRVPCPRCGQDWLYVVQLQHLAQDAVFCPECEALWLAGEDPQFTNFREYGKFMRAHGRIEPQAPGEYLVRGPFRKTTRE
jgi:ribosomal protein S27AE